MRDLLLPYLPTLLLSILVSVSAPSCKKNKSEGESGASSEEPSQAAAAERDDASPAPKPRDPEELARRVVIVDGHIDVPYRLEKGRQADGSLNEDISERTEAGDFDYLRAAAGGLDAPFMSIYVPARFQKSGGAKAHADKLIDMVEGFAKANPDKFALASSPEEILENKKAGKISLPMGIENGAALEGKLENLDHFYRRGVRYITLTHAEDNDICDSSYADTRTWKGLSDFGREVVKKMNDLGIMIDVSHISDEAFDQVIELSDAPVIASHSSCRHFTPGWERNMSDDMIRALAEKDGVIMINFGSSFVNEESRKAFNARREAVAAYAEKKDLDRDTAKVEAFGDDYDRRHPRRYATVEQVADHIDHVVELVGVEHVGLGSDFDGVGDSLPTGLKDVSEYPNLVRILVERGYTDEEIAKICGENALRVWRAVAERGRANPSE